MVSRPLELFGELRGSSRAEPLARDLRTLHDDLRPATSLSPLSSQHQHVPCHQSEKSAAARRPPAYRRRQAGKVSTSCAPIDWSQNIQPLVEKLAEMRDSWAPRILRPDYTWPCPIRAPICTATPHTPTVSSRTRRRVIGYMHNVLIKLSRWYCTWFGLSFDSNIVQLPFGLVMKRTDRTTVEEMAAMMMARASGMPVPKVLSCGEHPGDPYRRYVSILMTRLPGCEVVNSFDLLEIELEEPWLFELTECLSAMRQWRSPYGRSTCSVLNTSLRSTRVPNHSMGPFPDAHELYEYLFSAASTHGFESVEKYNDALMEAKKLEELTHRATFTHGDFKHHNILVGDDGHLTGLLDWESSGWYPEHWDFTTAMRSGSKTWWGQAVAWMGGNQYSKELSYDKALNSLTVDSYAGW